MIWIRDVKCPSCESNHAVTVHAILKSNEHNGPEAYVELVCEDCRLKFGYEDSFKKQSQANQEIQTDAKHKCHHNFSDITGWCRKGCGVHHRDLHR